MSAINHESRWERPHDATCHRCSRTLTSRDSLAAQICRACSEHAHCDCDQMDRPHNVFVTWRGVRLGFETMARAQRYVRIAREANDPRYYSGPPMELPVLEQPAERKEETLADLLAVE